MQLLAETACAGVHSRHGQCCSALPIMLGVLSASLRSTRLALLLGRIPTTELSLDKTLRCEIRLSGMQFVMDEHSSAGFNEGRFLMTTEEPVNARPCRRNFHPGARLDASVQMRHLHCIV